MENYHEIRITKIASTITSLLGIESHGDAAEPIDQVLAAAKEKFGAEGCDRVFMYNPDAIAAWVYHKNITEFAGMDIDLTLPMLSMVPSETVVCFSSMYTGMLPAQHGIVKHVSVKPVLTVDTVFDDLIRAGKKPAIVSTTGDTISKVFLNRQMDYFIYDTIAECNAKALELIEEDKYDLIVLYNGNFDATMHGFGGDSQEALQALRENVATFGEMQAAIRKHWNGHRTALAFAPDHGCTDRGHGSDLPSDMTIMHLYSFI